MVFVFGDGCSVAVEFPVSGRRRPARRAAAVLTGRPRGEGAKPPWRPSVVLRRERGRGVGRPTRGRSLRRAPEGGPCPAPGSSSR